MAAVLYYEPLVMMGPGAIARVCGRFGLTVTFQRPDKALKGCRLRLEQKCPRPAGARRGTALLYGSGQLAWVDCWQPPHPVTGRRPVHRASLAQVESWAAAPGLPIEKGDTE